MDKLCEFLIQSLWGPILAKSAILDKSLHVSYATPLNIRQENVQRQSVGNAVILGTNQKTAAVSINSLNDCKSPGSDGLPAELYKKCKYQLVKILKHAYDEGIKKGKMHESFYKGILTLIHKKGSEENINNYRHLTLMNMDYKVYAKIIANKIEEQLGIIVESEQSCAIKGRYIWDNLNTLREIIWNKQESNFYIIALDQKKAFDFISFAVCLLILS
uniref:Reverse transcriptase domain-containing protein n=1 Tax=Astyanax mexicanus TaxID=7994 RepID=A0A3B1K6F9_ASTMX